MTQEPDKNIGHIQNIENFLIAIEQELMEIDAGPDEHLVSLITHYVKHIETDSLMKLRRALENSVDNGGD